MSDPASSGRHAQILVICRANVCRSPFAAELLRERLRLGSTDVPVLSAGIHPQYGSALCGVAAAELRGRPHSVSFGVNHEPAAVTEDLARSSDLILTMGESHRAAVIALSAELRSRTFTLIEARFFAQAAATAAQGAARTAAPPAALGSSGPAGWADALNGMRGQVALPTRGARRHGTTGISIEDGHSASNRVHRRTLATVEREVTALADALLALRARPSQVEKRDIRR